MRRYLGATLLIAAAACAKKQAAPTVQTALVNYRDVIVDAQANGVIEPIVIVDVKSKASGVITQMPVETGTLVKPGDLIVQVDTRDVQNRYNQAKAALDAAQAKLSVAESDKKRNEEMFKARVITPQEYEQVAVSYENAKSGVVNATAALDLARQSLEDATVKAASDGTIITKNVAVGTVIASATGTVSGGTTIVQMADLSVVRIRALFNENDIGNVHPGEAANVTVDAYPDRRFGGVVEKIEPQAVIQQNVTMFPVLVNLENHEGLLKPGMNGEVSVLIDERDNVLAIPNDAIKSPREAVATGAMLGMSADTITAELRAQGFSGGGGNRGGFGGGNRGGRRNGGNGNGGGAAPGTGAASAAPGGAKGSANGDIAFAQQGQQGPGNFGQQASDGDCKRISDVLKAPRNEKKQFDSLRGKLAALRPAGFSRPNGGGGGGNPGNGGNGGGANRQRGAGRSDSTGGRQRGSGGGGGGGFRGSPEMQAVNEQLRAIYTALNIDPRTAGSCARRQQGAAQASNGGASTGGQGARSLSPSPESGGPQRTRTGLVFVTDSSKTKFAPRIVKW